ncbi:MAG: hypothetical protein EPN89_11885 [Methylovulum sp.]|nr:MAG: hypothetical protein EPN89_11885 [Methylovulum sp.]
MVITDQDHIYTTSLLVAEKFDKQHKNVLRDIEAILKKCPDKEFNRLNFEPISYLDAMNREQKAYNLSRDGFTLLVRGFTGDKAFLWNIAFISAFNRMEQLLNQALVTEHRALIDGLFAKHPQWRETAAYLQQGKSNREIADRQGKHIRNVQKMIVRMNAAGLNCRHLGIKPSTDQQAA